MGAKKVLLSIISGEEAELQMDELTQITEYINSQSGDEAEVIFGHGVDTNLGDRIRVTVIATGFDAVGKTLKKEDKKVHELDKSQISLFGNADNSVNQRHQDLELKLKEPISLQEDTPVFSFENFIDSAPVNDEKKLPVEELTDKKAYTFEWMADDNKNSRIQQEEDNLFGKDDEFELGKGISSEEIIDEDGMMEYRRTRDRLEEQAAVRRERLKASKKGEMTKEEFNEKWTLPAYLRRGVKMDNVSHSSESFISRYNLNDDNSLLGNNKFLHDNVD
jgi:cell division protein FtsZ